MAIDTAEKRRSVSGVWLTLPGVTPQSLKDGEWRQESGWSYAGILAGEEVAAEVVGGGARRRRQAARRYEQEPERPKSLRETADFVTELFDKPLTPLVTGDLLTAPEPAAVQAEPRNAADSMAQMAQMAEMAASAASRLAYIDVRVSDDEEAILLLLLS